MENEDLKIKNLKLENFILKNNIKNSFSRWGLDNAFIAFNFNDFSYLIYATKYKSIISFNLNEEIIVSDIKKAHTEDITNFRYYIKEEENKCIIMSISGDNRNIKLWDFLNWECILNLSSIYDYGLIFSSCFLNEENELYIITCCSSDDCEIKIYNLLGNNIKVINDSKEKALFIDCVTDKINLKKYIIVGNDGYIKSYDLNENKLYHKYKDFGNAWHCSIKSIFNKNKLKLLDSCWGDDYIRIWDFHLGTLITQIRTFGKNIKSLCVYDNNFILVGCYDHTMKLVDILNKKVVKTFEGHKDWVCTINKIYHKKFGEYIISEGLGKNEMIKIWIIDNSIYNNNEKK